MARPSMADAALSQSSSHHDARIAVRNALQLGLSLVAMYGIGTVVHMFFLPRVLGPEALGVYTAADYWASLLFLATTFGMEPYTQKEVSVRQEHANDFSGTIILLRVVMFFALTALLTLGLTLNGQSALVRIAAVGMAGMYALSHHNSAWAALLTAAREVKGLAKINVATKLVWGVAVVTTVLLGGGVLGVVVSLLLGELVRTVLLTAEVFRRIPLKLKVDWPATRKVLWRAFPFMLNSLSLVYSRLDVTMMSFWHMDDKEIGWYGNAVRVSGFTLALMPLLGGAVVPLFARAAARSQEELDQMGARTLSSILTFAIPGGFGTALGSELLVRLAQGESYLPGVPALMILCANFTFTYVAVICSYFTWAKRGPWWVTMTSALGLVVNPALNLLLIRPLAAYGAGWAGTGAALATVGTELFVITILLTLVGKNVFDRRLRSMLLRTVLVMLVVAGLHVQLRPLVESPPAWLGAPHGLPVLAVRLLIEAAAYVVLAVVTRAVNIRETLEFARSAMRTRQEQRQEPKAA